MYLIDKVISNYRAGGISFSLQEELETLSIAQSYGVYSPLKTLIKKIICRINFLRMRYIKL